MHEELCLGMYLTNAVDFYKLRLDEWLRSSSIGSNSAGNLLDRRNEAALIDAIWLATPAFLSPKDEAMIPSFSRVVLPFIKLALDLSVHDC